MKQFLAVTLISIIAWGCYSGNKPSSESEAVESASGPDSIVESTPNGNTGEESESMTAPEPASKLDELRMGMKEEEVIEMLGEPRSRETIGNDPKVKAEDWYYGENQKVRMINGEVNFVVKDVARQMELLHQLMEAKKNKDEAAELRIIEELTKGHK